MSIETPEPPHSAEEWAKLQQEKDFSESGIKGHAAVAALLEAVRQRTGAELWDRAFPEHRWLLTMQQAASWVAIKLTTIPPQYFTGARIPDKDGKAPWIVYSNMEPWAAAKIIRRWWVKTVRRAYREARWLGIKNRFGRKR